MSSSFGALPDPATTRHKRVAAAGGGRASCSGDNQVPIPGAAASPLAAGGAKG